MNLEAWKQKPFVQPLMPYLRTCRRSVWHLQHLPELILERRRSQRWSKAQNILLYPAIEKALKQVEDAGGFFGGWALSASAIRMFTQTLMNTDSQQNSSSLLRIVEFGSGQSTLFWGNFLAMGISLDVHTYEHHPYWAEQSLMKTGGRVNVHHVPLRQVSAEVKDQMFKMSGDVYEIFEQGEVLPESEWENTRTKNAFYAAPFDQHFEKASIHGVILDGPNGSGRSLAFPLLMPYLAPKALILIDDYDHYPFLEDLQKLSDSETLYHSHSLGKRWCLIRLR